MSERMTDAACCAHLTVLYGTEEVGDGLVRGYWRCRECQADFVPSAVSLAEVRRLRDLYEPEERDETPVHVRCGTVPYPNPVPGGFDYDCKTCGMCFDMDRTVPRWRYDAAQRILRGE